MDFLFKYISKHYCPHDICSEEVAYSWTRAHCDYYNDPEERHIFPDPCRVCWDSFITEVLSDIVKEEEE